MLPAVRVAAQLHRSHSSNALLAEHYGRVVGRQVQIGSILCRSLVRMVGSFFPSVRAAVIAVQSCAVQYNSTV